MNLRFASPARAGVLCAVVAGGICAAPASASIVNIFSDVPNSENQLGEFTGTIEYIAGAGQGTLNVSLTNTSPAANGGFITGFAFNIDSTDAGATASLTSGTHPFVGINNVNAQPYGMGFNSGAALGGNWQGGGNPSFGIAVGDTGVFSFDVTASDAAGLTASAFALTGPFDFNFVVRFRGFIDGDSDKVPAVPAPGALALLGLGGLVAARRRR